jgi:hypothetical protein
VLSLSMVDRFGRHLNICEKLPQFCYMCGRIIHTQNNCIGRVGGRMNEDSPAKQWGVWLRADDLKFHKSRPVLSTPGHSASPVEEPRRRVLRPETSKSTSMETLIWIYQSRNFPEITVIQNRKILKMDRSYHVILEP